LRITCIHIFSAILFFTSEPVVGNEPLESRYDLRSGGYVTPVKNQTGGTCWCHGTMASIESNLLKTGYWDALGRTDWPNLAEYHLDWWNGFNEHNNDDAIPTTGGGLVVHEGGDYLVAAAYMSRGDGVIHAAQANSNGERDRLWYDSTPARYASDYEVLYVRDIEWYTAGADLSGIDTIKNAVVTHGAVATCMAYSSRFIISGRIHYQPPTDDMLPNHSVAIVGWDDNKATQAPEPGAWICRNSWGSSWNGDGYFWISYYDKHCCQDPEMGAVSFQDVQVNIYDHIYYHDYHGWRDTKTDCNEAFNAFVAGETEQIAGLSFYTTAEDVSYTTVVYDSFQDGCLLGRLSAKAGEIVHSGFHTVVPAGDDFYVYLRLSKGGHAYDRTSEVKVLLDDPPVTNDPAIPPFGPRSDMSIAGFSALGKMAVTEGDGALVISSSRPGQSYYYDGSEYRDLYDFDSTANFCIKALAMSLNTDLNGDAATNLADFAVLANAWQTGIGDKPWDSSCDLNRDSVVDVLDVSIFSGQWLTIAPAEAR